MGETLGYVGMSPVARARADQMAGQRGGRINAALMRKLTNGQVRVIRERRAGGEGCGSIAAELPVSPGVVYRVGLGRTYADVLNADGTIYVPSTKEGK